MQLIETLSLEQLEKLHEIVAYHHQLKCSSTAKFSNNTADPMTVKARKSMKRSKSSGSEYGFLPIEMRIQQN